MLATVHDISTPLARRRARDNRACPFCGKIALRVHMQFDRDKFPDLPYSAWVYVCGDCHFMGHLTGDKEQDLKARNLFDVKACDG